MTTAQWIYIVLLATYVALFLVFSRMFLWKFQAERNFYRQRPANLSKSMIEEMAHREGKEVPHFSIFVPARNEADVIEKTIEHLAHLNYSPDHYEVLVVTDEKEAQATAKARQQVVESLTAFLVDDAPWTGGEQQESVLMALLSRLALEEAQLAERKASPYLSMREILTLAPHYRQEILSEISQTLLSGNGHIDRERLYSSIRRCLPQTEQSEASRFYPIFLSLAIPTVMAATQLKKEQPDQLVAKLMNEAAQARQALTQKVLTALSETVGSRIVERIRDASAEQLSDWLIEASVDALPTTQDIVERKRREYAPLRDKPAIKHVEVPWDFDGYLDGVCTGHFVPSTKGRALNYAFRFADDKSAIWGFYDAESRPEPDALLYIAWRRLKVGDKFQIAQGPVYQVRNFWKLSPLTKIAGIYQAISHEWRLPLLLDEIPFTGGTNMWVGRDLMIRIGGFDDTVLTEDMELGARAWIKGGAWPEFVPCYSSEQTPTSYKAFFRQRLRWGSGYLQVYDKLKADPTLDMDKKSYLLRTYWWMGHFSWTLFQAVALLPLAVPILRWNDLLDPKAVPDWINWIVLTFSPIYLLFTFYSFFHHYKHMDPAPKSTKAFGFAQLFLMPVSAFFLPIPYSSSLVLKAIGRAPKAWVKTPRTKD